MTKSKIQFLFQKLSFLAIFCKNGHFLLLREKTTQEQDVFKNYVKTRQSRPILAKIGRFDPKMGRISKQKSLRDFKIRRFLGHSSRKWVDFRVRKPIWADFGGSRSGTFVLKWARRAHFKTKVPRGPPGPTPPKRPKHLTHHGIYLGILAGFLGDP